MLSQEACQSSTSRASAYDQEVCLDNAMCSVVGITGGRRGGLRESCHREAEISRKTWKGRQGSLGTS